MKTVTACTKLDQVMDQNNLCQFEVDDTMYHTQAGDMIDGLRIAQHACHALAKNSGWWSHLDGSPKQPEEVNFAEKLCLIHSEVSEAMEGHRKNKMDEHLPHRKSAEVELSDALIRIFDLAGFYGLDLAGAVVEKLAYNQERADHKLTNRAAEGGKAY